MHDKGNLFRMKSINRIDKGREYSDEDILEGIEANNHKVLEWLYKHYFPMIVSMVKNAGGSASDATDIFQDGILAVYRRLRKEPLILTSTFRTFFYKICQNIAYKHLRRQSIYLHSADLSDITENGMDSDRLMKDVRYSMYQRCFRELSTDCQRIILMHLTKIPAKKIATILGISIAAVKKRKYLCKENLINKIKGDRRYKF